MIQWLIIESLEKCYRGTLKSLFWQHISLTSMRWVFAQDQYHNVWIRRKHHSFIVLSFFLCRMLAISVISSIEVLLQAFEPVHFSFMSKSFLCVCKSGCDNVNTVLMEIIDQRLFKNTTKLVFYSILAHICITWQQLHIVLKWVSSIL